MHTCFHQHMVLCLRTVTSFVRTESDRCKTVIREAEEIYAESQSVPVLASSAFQGAPIVCSPGTVNMRHSKHAAQYKASVMLDSTPTVLYRVSTSRLNEAVKRNIRRFPDDFMFQLTKEAFENLISQIATSSSQLVGAGNYHTYLQNRASQLWNFVT